MVMMWLLLYIVKSNIVCLVCAAIVGAVLTGNLRKSKVMVC